MTKEETTAFLLAGSRTGKLATVGVDGAPQVTPIWFTLDGDDVVFTIWHTTLNAKNLRRNPRGSMVVDLEEPPFAFVQVNGTVEITDDADDLLHWATVIAGRYMGPERAEEFGRRNAVPGELLVRLRPEKVIARHGISE